MQHSSGGSVDKQTNTTKQSLQWPPPHADNAPPTLNGERVFYPSGADKIGYKYAKIYAKNEPRHRP